jgi:hypothetical protein
MSDPRLDAIRGNAIRGIQRRADDVRDRSYAAAEWCDVRFLLAELERVTAALREAEEAMTEAWEYLAHDEGDAAAVVLEAALAGGARAAQDENA